MRAILRSIKQLVTNAKLAVHGRRLGHMGAGCEIDTGVSLQYPGQIRMGDGTRIGRFATLRANTDQNPGIRLGKQVLIQDHVVVNANRGFVTMGDRSWLGPFCLVYGNGGVTIGNDVLVAGHSTINTVSHGHERCDIPVNDQPLLLDPVVLEDDVWLGLNVTVLQGVTIGRGSIVGAGAVVTKSIPPWSIAVGVPAKVVGRREGAPHETGESA